MSSFVSIIIPCYNYERYIIDCLLSCVNQNYSNVEIIVIDDASTDNSVEMAEKVTDSRIKIIQHSENKGYSAAKNTGIIECQGDYIIPLDVDDMMTTVGVSKRVRYLDEHPEIDFVSGIAYKFEGSGSYSKALRKQHRLPFDRRCRIHAQGLAYRRQVFKRYGLYFEPMRSKADKEYNTRLELMGARFGKIMTKCAFYRIHDKSMLAMRNRNKAYDNKITQMYNDRVKQIKKEGLTKDNTRWPLCDF